MIRRLVKLAWSSAGKELRNLSGISWMASACLQLPDSSPEQEISMKRRAGKDREWEQWQDIYWKLAGAAAAISVTLEPHNNSGWEMEASWVATERGSGRISAFRYSGVDDYISRM